MPIQSTSAPNLQAREVEKASASTALRASAQGSISRGKDSFYNSIWEKAINGAQQLFGLSRADRNIPEDPDQGDAEGAPASTGPRQENLGLPGLRRPALGRFGASFIGGSAFASVSAARQSFESAASSRDALPVKAAPERYKPQADALRLRPAPDVASENATKEVPSAAEDPSGRESQSEEEGENSTDSKVRTRSKAALLAPTAASTQPATPSAVAAVPPVDAASSPVAATGTGIGAALPMSKAEAKRTVPARHSTGEASEKLSPAKLPTPAAASEHAGSGTTQIARAASSMPAPAPLVSADKLSREAKPLRPGLEASASKPASSPASDAGADRQILGASTARAKADLTAPAANPLVELGDKAKELAAEPSPRPLGKNTASAAAKAAPAPAVAPALADAASRPMQVQDAPHRAADSASSEPKDGSQLLESAKREASALPGQPRAGRQGEGQSASAQGAQGSRAADPAPTPKLSSESMPQDPKSPPSAQRDASALAATRMPNPVAQSKGQATQSAQLGQGSGALSGATSVAQSAASQTESQMGRQQGGLSGKQDFGSTLPQTAQKGGEKPAGEAAQSFESKVQAASARRSEAAARSGQTSYVSKTASEIKEVVATLSKSIDRLATSKMGSMNLTLNFEGGGSMSLRFKMEGAQIATIMQTDVSGLEGAIKSNWAEIASDWNQKGIKLNLPQFQSADTLSGKASSFDDLGESSQKGGRQADGREDASQGRGSARSSRPASGTGYAEGTASGLEAQEDPASGETPLEAGSMELKAYA